MTTESQVITVEEISADKAPAIFGQNKLAAYVEAARLAVIDEVPDLTTRKGRERIASLAAQVARSKTAVEKPGREYLKRIKELPRTIEAELREFVAKKIGALARPDDVLFSADLPKTRSGKIMRRLLRDIAEGRALGDTTTLADPNVVAALKDQYEKDES